jgi:hypothetical protein
MPDSLHDLETRRAELALDISRLGDFRCGSITTTTGRCGNPNCHCHQPGHSGHGPNIRLTRKVNGKTVTETFPSPAAQRKAEREVSEFRRYQELSRAFVETNEKVCRARPVDETLSPQEKKRPKRSSKKSVKK